MTDQNPDPHQFEFDLDRGIRAQAVEKLSASPLLPLKKGVAPQQSGVYALYHKGAMVYIGKASKGTFTSKRTLRTQLKEQVAKIPGQKDNNLGEVTHWHAA